MRILCYTNDVNTRYHYNLYNIPYTGLTSTLHVHTYLYPRVAQIIAIGVCDSAQALDCLNILRPHFSESHRSGQHGEVGQRLNEGITLQL